VSTKILAFLQNRELLRNNKQKAWLEALALLGKKDDIVALETGRIRNPAWRYSDGNSTWFLTRLPTVKTLISIDNDSENFTGLSGTAEFCRKYLSPAQLAKVELHDGNSVEVLKKLNLAEPLDFVLLDSANDPQLIFDELAAVLPLMNQHECVLVIDDVHHPGHKGDRAIPWLVQSGYEPRYITAAPGDCCYFVLHDALRVQLHG
jgi:cystathionine beta-lyase/cystathionine gamma-synthase